MITILVAVAAIIVAGIVCGMVNTQDPEESILWCLRHEPGMRGLELCAITGISRSVIYVHLGRLEEAGRVRKENVLSAAAAGINTFRYYVVEGK